MKIEEEIFKKLTINEKCLLDFGFVKKDDFYSYEEEFMNRFKAIIIYDLNKITGKIIDIKTDSEYEAFRFTDECKTYSGKVLKEYTNILQKIANNCCNSNLFSSKQANRITKKIKELYNYDPEFLFKTSPDSGIFRLKNGKWFGIIMNINLNKISGPDEVSDILNVKIEPNKIIELLKHPGFYKAYHMNKKYWITLSLNEIHKDEDILSLVSESIKNVE